MQAEAFEAITGVPLSGHALTQARLPLRYGGLGMLSCESIRLGTFVASFFFTMSRAQTLLQMQTELLLVSTSILTALRNLRPLLAELPTTCHRTFLTTFSPFHCCNDTVLVTMSCYHSAIGWERAIRHPQHMVAEVTVRL